MRPSDPPRPPADATYLAAISDLAARHGLTHTGVAPAGVLARARRAIQDRIDRDLVDGMQFTFKNPRRSTDPRLAVHAAQAVFVAARPYLLEEPAAPDSPGPYGRVARYAWVDHYAPLRDGLWAVANRLRSDGWKAVVFADDNSIVDREVAHLAGIGWYGKNANLLIPGAGSWFVLGCVVTTAPLPVNERLVDDGCGSCQACIVACPTGAIIEPGVIDATRCLAWVLQKPGIIPHELRRLVGDRIYGCDDCQEVCPPTVRFGPRHRAAPAKAAAPWKRVLPLLTGTDDELIHEWGRWYLADRDPRWIRRNALVVLGNVGDPGDPHVRAVVARYVSHRDPMLRAHAVWAARRLLLSDLMPSSDPDPDVQRELVTTV